MPYLSNGVLTAVLVNVILIAVLLFIVRPIYEYYWYKRLQKALLKSLDSRLESCSQDLSRRVMSQLEILVGRKLREGMQEWRAHNEGPRV